MSFSIKYTCLYLICRRLFQTTQPLNVIRPFDKPTLDTTGSLIYIKRGVIENNELLGTDYTVNIFAQLDFVIFPL